MCVPRKCVPVNVKLILREGSFHQSPVRGENETSVHVGPSKHNKDALTATNVHTNNVLGRHHVGDRLQNAVCGSLKVEAV